MNESYRTTSASLLSMPVLLGCMTMVTSFGCASPGFGTLASSADAGETHQMASSRAAENATAEVAALRIREVQPLTLPMPENARETSLVSTRISAPVRSNREAIIDLAAGADLRQQLADAHGGVLLDFYADWCGPCRKQGQLLHEVEGIANETGTTIIKINIDNHPDVARALSVSSLPTLLMVKDGKVTHRQTGVATPKKLASWMQ